MTDDGVKVYLSKAEVARILRRTRQRISQKMRQRDIRPAAKIGNVFGYEESAVQALLGPPTFECLVCGRRVAYVSGMRHKTCSPECARVRRNAQEAGYARQRYANQKEVKKS